jgi:CRP/FNR family transcriptional regulator
MKTSLALPLALAALLTACATPEGEYPSLAVRDVERVGGQFAVPEPVALPQPPAPTIDNAEELAARAREAHAELLAQAEEFRPRFAAARGAARGSEDWAQANVALAVLQSTRSEAMIALADLDHIYVEAAVEGLALDPPDRFPGRRNEHMNLACSVCPVRDRAACSVLSEAERDELARAGRTRKLKRGELLFAAGDEDTVCATLIKGALKVTSYDEEGNERILALIHPSGFIGELFAPFASYDVVALAESELCVFGKADMAGAIDRYPELARALLRRSEEDLHRAHSLIAMSSRRSAAGKIGALVLSLAQAASSSPCHPALEFDLPLTRGEMAGMLGLTIETVSRTLTALERDGVLERKGARGIALLDPTRLEDAA